MYILIPLFIFYSFTLGIGLSVLINTYLIPYLGLTEAEKVPMATGIIIVGIILGLYFYIMTRGMESENFKAFLYKKKKNSTKKKNNPDKFTL